MFRSASFLWAILQLVIAGLCAYNGIIAVRHGIYGWFVFNGIFFLLNAYFGIQYFVRYLRSSQDESEG